jgi:hypothetical protein
MSTASTKGNTTRIIQRCLTMWRASAETSMKGLKGLPPPARISALARATFCSTSSEDFRARVAAQRSICAVLAPLSNLAAELDIVVITVGHFNRSERGTDPLHRMIGAAAFSGVALARCIRLRS